MTLVQISEILFVIAHSCESWSVTSFLLRFRLLFLRELQKQGASVGKGYDAGKAATLCNLPANRRTRDFSSIIFPQRDGLIQNTQHQLRAQRASCRTHAHCMTGTLHFFQSFVSFLGKKCKKSGSFPWVMNIKGGALSLLSRESVDGWNETKASTKL